MISGPVATRLRFVVLEGPHVDYPGKFRAAIRNLGLDAEVETVGTCLPQDIGRSELAKIRHILRRRHPQERVFLCPGTAELFLACADVTFAFSAYRSWHDPERIKVMPHPWTAVWPENRQQLEWREKPPRRLGFMGSTYANSRFVRLTSKFPRKVREWILAGGFARRPDIAAWLKAWGFHFPLMSAFVRSETLNAVLREARKVAPSEAVEIVDTRGFDGTMASRRAFADHLSRMTYVLCPRGYENYSWRMYEALRFGRVPVVFDTDLVLPMGVDWERVALIVPGDDPGKAYQMILDDHRGRSVDDFRERQARAFAASRYIDSEAWLPGAIQEAVTFVEQRMAA